MHSAAYASDYLRDNQTLVCTTYFTARMIENPDKNKRHSTYLDALKSTGRVEVIEENFPLEPFRGSNSHNQRGVPKEKWLRSGEFWF